MKPTLFIGILLLLIPGSGFALPKTQSTPGGISNVYLPTTNHQAPEVFFKDAHVIVMKESQSSHWFGLVGIPLIIKSSKQTLEIRNLKKSVTFKVHQKRYRKSRIWLKDNKMINPSKKDQARIQKEAKEIRKVLRKWSENDPFKQNYRMPVNGRITARFGTLQIFNYKIKEPHQGIDIYAKQGTPIYPCNAGIVLKTGNYFFLGNTIFIDHGKGVISLYAHLDKIWVKEGRHLTKETPLGSIGQTGRATGPHLHWAMVMNQTFVNPKLFVR